MYFFFFFFKQKTAYEMLRSLVGSEMCIRDRAERGCACRRSAGQRAVHHPRGSAQGSLPHCQHQHPVGTSQQPGPASVRRPPFEGVLGGERLQVWSAVSGISR
eukprot:TRINITY_DN28553_c0_g1_i1.p3 TRINITY_DN28553_c0_g1~~TRINITY_DN28553_c0_g1_i1.p3  ORF type:complete len:103 (+),score=24.81 TRINITY_DN28553_c0_g1_i1:30-338(+)